MRRIRSLTRQAPAIIIALVALSISLGGGAWAATRSDSHRTQTGIAPAGVTWHTIPLLNGWTSSQSVFNTGDPRVAINSLGVVFLSGSLHQATPGSATFATLASTYRPTHNLYITVYTNGGTSGTLYIGHDGTMEAFSNTSCGSANTAQCFTSLATVSYPKTS